MYLIYLDGELFYDPRIPETGLTDMTLDLEVNKNRTLKFTLPAAHPKIDELRNM